MNPNMTRSEFDRIFTEHWEEFNLYATRYVKHLGLSIRAEDSVTGAYLHLLKEIEELHEGSEIVSHGKNWIKMNLRWTQSPLRREHRGREHAELGDWDQSQTVDPDWERIDPLTSLWVKRLDLRSRRIWSLYWDLDLRRGRELAEHLNISTSGAYLLLKEARELEQSYREWILKHLN